MFVEVLVLFVFAKSEPQCVLSVGDFVKVFKVFKDIKDFAVILQK